MKTTDRITDEILTPAPTKRSKLANYVAYVAMGLIAITVGVFLYWSLQDEDVLQVNNEPFPVRTIREHPTADGVIILNVDFCKQTEATGRLRMSFVSKSREIFLPVVEEKGTTGCTKTEFPILIPHETPGDTYRVKFQVDYPINPLKTVREEFVSSEFTVDETE